MRILNAILLIYFFCAGAQAQRLNFLFVHLDDTAFSSGDYSQHLPCVKSLEAQAVVFENFYTAVPAETTVEILTGKYPASIKNVAFGKDLDEAEPSFMRDFKDLDYATAYIGKWRNTQEASGFANNFGFDLFYGVLDSDSKWPYEWQRKAVKKGNLKSDGVGINSPSLAMYQGASIIDIRADNKKLVENFSKEALSFIDSAYEAKQPFFVYLNFASAYSMERAIGYFFEEDEGVAQNAYAKHYAEVDKAMAKILKDLERKEILEQTVVVFISTNALKEPAPKVDYSQNSAPEQKHKLSAFVRAPQVFTQAENFDGIVNTTDMSSLLKDIAHLKTPEVILAKYRNKAKPVLYYATTKKLLGIKLGNYKFLINIDWKKLKAQLYDLNTDPYEQNDLSESMPDKVAELKTLLWQLDSRVVKIFSPEEIEKRKKEAEKNKKIAKEKAEKEAKNKAQKEKERLKKEEKERLKKEEKQKKKEKELKKDKQKKEEKLKKKVMSESPIEESSEE